MLMSWWGWSGEGRGEDAHERGQCCVAHGSSRDGGRGTPSSPASQEGATGWSFCTLFMATSLPGKQGEHLSEERG